MDLTKLKNDQVDEEFENFLMKVTSVSNIIREMCSDDDEKAEIATRKADLMLGNDNIEINEDDIHVKTNKTIINQQAFNDLGKKDGPQTLHPEEFMRTCEKDAKERAERRRLSKETADGLMKRGNQYFRKKEYEKALNLYNQALDEVRDSCLLYTNHALTCLHLRLFERVVKDCDKALRLDENSMKALLYKARALMWMAKEEEAGKVVEEALEKHPEHSEYIKDYISRWEEKLQ